MHSTLNKIPSLLPLYISALMKSKKGLTRELSVPNFSAEAPFVIKQAWLDQYRDICGWKKTGLPLTAPQVYAAPIHTYLLAHAECPVPMLGLVHAGNQIVSTCTLPIDTPLIVKVWFGATRWKAKGYEFDLHTAIKAQEDECDWSKAPWQACTSIFRTVSKEHQQLSESFQPSIDVHSQHDFMHNQSLDLPAHLGRKYGKIAGDRNPIHLYPWSARLFGFNKPIMHGMWTLARSLAFLEESHPHYDLSQGTLEVRFKKPIFLPSQIQIQIQNHSHEDLKSPRVNLSVFNHKEQYAIDAFYCA